MAFASTQTRAPVAPIATLGGRAARAPRVQAFTGMKVAKTACLGSKAAPSLSGKVSAAVRRASGKGSRMVVTMAKKSVSDLGKAELEGKTVFVRCDLNVPLDKDLNITDDTRIRAALPTLKYLMDNGAKLLVTSHLGRPKDGPEDKFRLAPVVARMTELLGKEVKYSKDCIGEEAAAVAKSLGNGDIAILENVRFYKEETKNVPEFAEKLAANADIFVNDAFGTAHRAHASTEGVTKYLKPSVAGLLLQKELDYLEGAVTNPKRPFVAIVGGSKVSSKIGVMESLIEKCDKIIVGGGMVFTFFKANGMSIGGSLVEDDKLDLAKELMAKAAAKGCEFLLPTDVIIADKFAEDANTKTVSVNEIPDGWMGLDVGPDSVKAFENALSDCKTVVWNGPMGVFEMDKFAAGTLAIADYLADLTDKGCITIIGGGDSVAAVEKANKAEKMSHISTGGGASLELLEGKVLPGVAALNEA